MNRRVLWVSTGLDTQGGVASAVRLLCTTPLVDRWEVRHVATHRDGAVIIRMVAFARGALHFSFLVVLRRPALVHLHSASRGSFARKSLLAWACHVLHVPVVFHVHGGGFSAFFERSPAWVRRYIRSTLERADAVIALGETWAGRLRHIAPEAEVVVVPNGVVMRERVQQSPSGQTLGVLFLGAVCEDKGTFLLIDVWSDVVQAAPHKAGLNLVVAGGGEVGKARARVSGLRLDDSVSVVGWVDHDEAERLLRSSQILVLPSRAEGQPMAVLEAMAAGLCVIATRVGGVPDLLDDTCGILVPVDDGPALREALLEVVADPAKRARLGEAGHRQAASRFDVDQVWRRLDRLYEAVAR